MKSVTSGVQRGARGLELEVVQYDSWCLRMGGQSQKGSLWAWKVPEAEESGSLQEVYFQLNFTATLKLS